MNNRRGAPFAVAGLLIALVVGSAPAATAGPTAVDREAAAILATATAGEPLTVVTTVQTADGPRFVSEQATSRGDALDLIVDALDDDAAAAVGLAHPVSAADADARSSSRRVNDTLRDRQWALSRLGAEKVWRKSTGSEVIVAVVDSGVSRQHPDLAGRVIKGYDFVADDNAADDSNGHGTHVAGIIAATEDNRRGIAGLAPSATILPVRVLDGAGIGTTLSVARGIAYAVRKGANVINLSLTGDQPDPQVEAAIRYAVDNDVVVVAAAGNQGCAGPAAYPAAYPGVIGVGALDRHGVVPSFSACGASIDVVAPGQQVMSTMIKRPGRDVPCAVGRSYCFLDGTSMAAPHAAAAAAILIARSRFRLSAARVGDIMRASADDIGVPGPDPASGSGALNVRRMLTGR